MAVACRVGLGWLGGREGGRDNFYPQTKSPGYVPGLRTWHVCGYYTHWYSIFFRTTRPGL